MDSDGITMAKNEHVETEYMGVYLNDGPGLIQLNKHAADGWRLVAVVNDDEQLPMAIMERRTFHFDTSVTVRNNLVLNKAYKQMRELND